ncbi:hypothetical protein H6F96_30785 [Microcoleus sp. FACHB-53]|nr:hypothetical protein [Microcoleus sp. FACHB-53]MBD2129854.1 hypothetical protein [Microcoleus sp. FACHB-1]
MSIVVSGKVALGTLGIVRLATILSKASTGYLGRIQGRDRSDRFYCLRD